MSGRILPDPKTENVKVILDDDRRHIVIKHSSGKYLRFPWDVARDLGKQLVMAGNAIEREVKLYKEIASGNS